MEPIIFKNYKHHSENINWKNALQEAETLYNEIAPKLFKQSDASLKEKTKKYYRKFRGFKQSAANYIINKRRLSAGNHALRPLYTIWTMLNSCNFRCTYCDNHQGESYYNINDPKRLNTEESKKLLKIMRTGSAAIYWCGGEPTMRKDLPELLNYASDIGFFPNIINTNGSIIHTRLKDPKWSKFLWQMDIIIVSLDGLNINKLKQLWGVNKPDQVVTNLLLLKKLQKNNKFKLAVNTVITPETIQEARDVLDFANDLGIWFVPVPVNHKHKPNDTLLNNKEYVELAELIIKRKREGYKIIGSEHFLRMLLFAKDYTCLTTLKPHVWSDGSMCWPCRATINVEPVNINLLNFNTIDEAYTESRKLINPDFFHGQSKSQCGGSCAWAQNYTTARYLEGLLSPLQSNLFGEIKEFSNSY